MHISNEQLAILAASLEGELFYDDMMRSIYATDASIYRELPLAVAYPKDKKDIKKLITFATEQKTSLIPRAAGTSLAGQCVGSGIVVDVTKYMNQVIEVNKTDAWARVQPGVIRDELNHHLEPFELFFGPNTSTANRATIGGMVGNNSCGSYSIVYGTTRDHVLEIECILSDGSEATFKATSNCEYGYKVEGNSLAPNLYQQIEDELNKSEIQGLIKSNFPKSNIHRRNTGYAVDALLESSAFSKSKEPFNFCNLICGSEGTLAFITEIKIHVDPLPPKHHLLIAAHFQFINEALKAVVEVMKHQPRAVELMDKAIMDCTITHPEHSKNRFFLEGDPEAILIIEVGDDIETELAKKADAIESTLKQNKFGYAYPKIYPPETNRVWELRKAGLGLLTNFPGDRKPVAVIEDTAVAVEDLPKYIEDFTALMDKHNQKAIYYAHAGAGELHLRPVLNLKDEKDRVLLRTIATESADLVKQYNGSLSGEHGDGRLRAEFIEKMVGTEIYQLFKRIKTTWDPNNVFNPGKIVDAPPMDSSLKLNVPDEFDEEISTVFRFGDENNILRAAEKCTGSGDCRKLPLSGGTMCPSYMATRNEKDTTRARANILREFLTNSNKQNRFNHKEIYDVMDLCLSCKGCKTECPSNVDMATLKAEFLHHYYKNNKASLATKLMANVSRLNHYGSKFPGITNWLAKKNYVRNKLGIAAQRSIPKISERTVGSWYKQFKRRLKPNNTKGLVYFFNDEFTNYNDAEIGITAIKLLYNLGYQVIIPKHLESGRAYFSKGFLHQARHLAMRNLRLLSPYISSETPLVGIEPSAILTFRDEYPNIVPEEMAGDSKKLGKSCLTIEEFIAKEWEKGNITADDFTDEQKHILLHGHCHQKALSSINHSAYMLSIPANYNVETIPSGCCGMAGSFGYEKEHYDVSMQIGELVLFPAVRKAKEEVIIAASGTSCRHQIKDGTQKQSQHPVEILYNALK